MNKIQLCVKLNKIHSYEAPAYGGYYGSVRYETRFIYNMTGEDGNTYVWKTSKVMMLDGKKSDAVNSEADYINEGDEFLIVGDVKGETEYKGKPQILINRVSVKKRFFAAGPDYYKNLQTDSLGVLDKVLRISYREYKNKYSDCETVIDSYDSQDKTIEVIVRNYKVREATA